MVSKRQDLVSILPKHTIQKSNILSPSSTLSLGGDSIESGETPSCWLDASGGCQIDDLILWSPQPMISWIVPDNWGKCHEGQL